MKDRDRKLLVSRYLVTKITGTLSRLSTLYFFMIGCENYVVTAQLTKTRIATKLRKIKMNSTEKKVKTLVTYEIAIAID